MSDDDASQTPVHRGPGGTPKNRELVDSWTPGSGYADIWGPYHQVLFRPHKVTQWIRFKIMSSGVIARRLWDEREALRVEYEAAHGDDPEQWPVRHPGIVLESVQWIAQAACLGCQWLERGGTSMKEKNWRARLLRSRCNIRIRLSRQPPDVRGPRADAGLCNRSHRTWIGLTTPRRMPSWCRLPAHGADQGATDADGIYRAGVVPDCHGQQRFALTRAELN